jgi:hypothetical protein
MTTPLTPAQLHKKTLDFFEEISLFEIQLYAVGIESRFSNDEDLKKFKKLRLKWSAFVDMIQIDIATVLVGELQKLESDFQSGIESLKAETQSMKDAVKFLNLLSSVLGIVDKIVDFVV